MQDKSMSKTLKTRRMLIYIVFGLLTVISILSLVMMLANATRSVVEINTGVSLLHGSSLGHNIKVLIEYGFNMAKGVGNSFFVAATSTLLSVCFSAMAAYALVAYDFKGKKIIYGFIVALIMIPSQVSMIGFYEFMIKLNLIDNFLPLILPSIAAPATVFFLVEYMSTVYNKDYADSARLDGASELKIFHSVMSPMMKPGLATMAIFSFVFSWNNFLMPLIWISKQSMYTLPMTVQTITAMGAGGHTVEWGAIYVGLSITVVPIIIVYLFLSRYIVGGGREGGVKG